MDHGDERFGACLTPSTIFSSQSSACICCFPPKTLTEVSNVFPSSVKHLHVSTPVVFLSHHSVHSLPLLSFALVCLFTCNRLKLLSRIYRKSTISSACVCLEIKPQNTRNTFNFLLIGVMKDCNISISRRSFNQNIHAADFLMGSFHNRSFSHRFWLQMCGFRFTPLPHMNTVSMFQLSDFTLGRMSFESFLSHRTSETWHSYENQQVSVTISTETWGLSFHTHIVTLFIFLKSRTVEG